MMNELSTYLPVLMPVIIIEFGLMIAALIHIFRHENYRIGNRVVWAIVSIVIGIIGPILYFTIGKGDD